MRNGRENVNPGMSSQVMGKRWIQNAYRESVMAKGKSVACVLGVGLAVLTMVLSASAATDKELYSMWIDRGVKFIKQGETRMPVDILFIRTFLVQ